MSTIFRELRAFIIPLKLSEYEMAYCHRIIDKHGGSVCQNQKDATLILTAIKSHARINRNVKNHQIPVVDIQWIKECDKSNNLLSLDDYLLIKSDQQLPAVAEILNRKFYDLPPEELQFDDTPGFFIEGDSSDEEEIIGIDPEFVNTKYECLRPTPYIPRFNKRLVSYLLILERKRQLDNEDKRSLSYRHAISAIKAYPREIKSSKEAEQIIGVGKKMAQKIKMFLDTGIIEEAELLRSNEQFRTLSLFNQVFGVGTVTANIWWNLGYRTLQEVLEKAKISPVVRLGITLLPDFSQLITQEDAKEIIQIIEKEVKSIDINIFVTPVGGYRRGKLKNGDLDLIISSHHVSVKGLIDKIIERLTKNGYLKHKLWKSTEKNKGKNQMTSSGNKQIFDDFDKCFCAFLQPSTGILRQVDLIIVSPKELPMAVLGWTGSRQFERSIRDYAGKERNMHVNSQSIYQNVSGFKKRIVVNSEEEAFTVIGVPYLDPEMRNC